MICLKNRSGIFLHEVFIARFKYGDIILSRKKYMVILRIILKKTRYGVIFIQKLLVIFYFRC